MGVQSTASCSAFSGDKCSPPPALRRPPRLLDLFPRSRTGHRIPACRMELVAGMVLAGRYRYLAEVGSGVTSQVVLAADKYKEREAPVHVIIKVKISCHFPDSR